MVMIQNDRHNAVEDEDLKTVSAVRSCDALN